MHNKMGNNLTISWMIPSKQKIIMQSREKIYGHKECNLGYGTINVYPPQLAYGK